jgi:cytochrome c-type biogenesis protein CcsB
MISLVFTIIATAGFIIYVINQNKLIYKWSYRILLLGFIAHTLFLLQQYIHLGAAPVITLKSAFGFFSWSMIGAYLIFHLKFKLRVFGSFIVPLATFFMITSFSIPGQQLFTIKPAFQNFWLIIHISTIFIGNGFFAITFISGIVYLMQEYQIKRKNIGPIYNRLPSLETLDSINHRSLIYGFPFLTAGIITGAVFAQHLLGSYWRWDPKEVWTLITWLLYAALLHERLAVGWRGRRAAVLSIVAFLILLFSFIGSSLWLSDYHSFSNLESRFIHD